MNDGQTTAETYDIATGTYTREVDGAVVESRPLSADELAAWTPDASPAADAMDALAAAADASPIASTRDMAVFYRAAADALRSQ